MLLLTSAKLLDAFVAICWVNMEKQRAIGIFAAVAKRIPFIVFATFYISLITVFVIY